MTDPLTHAPTTDVIPDMVIKRSPVYLHKEDVVRVLMDKMPGHVCDISTGGQWPGCRFLEFKHHGVINGLPNIPMKIGDFEGSISDYFTANYAERYISTPVEMVNKFFELFANYLLVWKDVDAHGNIIISYMSLLNEEDTADLQEVSADNRKQMNTKRAERKAAAEAAVNAEKLEVAELIALGKKAREHNLLFKLKEQEKTIEQLNKDLKNYKRNFPRNSNDE